MTTENAMPAPPTSLRWALSFTLTAGVLMVLTGLVMLSAGFVGGVGAPLDVTHAFLSNQRIVSVANIVLAVLVVAGSTRIMRGSRQARWLVGVGLCVTVLLNLFGFIISVSGPSAILIVVLAAAAGVAMTRPSANAHIRAGQQRRLEAAVNGPRG